jgi:PAS domain S-box-containing protein
LENEIHERVAKEKQLQTWLDNSPDCTKVVDLDLNLQYMSSAGVKGLKIDDVTEFYGKPYPFEFYPETFKNTMRNNIIKAKETGRTIIQEAPVVDIQGNEVWYHSTIVPVKDDEDQIEYFLIVSIDTTERKRAEIEISNHRENLQQLVSDRTAELEKEIKDRKNAEEQIKMNLEEKETLLKEIHHRVKNNMNVVSSLLSLHKNVTQNTEVKKALRESQGRIYAMSAVHETLYNSKSLADIDLIGYLKKLSASLLQTYSVNPGNVQMTVDGENVNVNIDKASPLGLAVNELISNALKYAFPDNRTGCIEIITGRKGDHLELNIKDNGVGMPDGFDWENSNTLGLKLVRNLVESQLNGSINMDNRDGTKFTLKLKLGP